MKEPHPMSTETKFAQAASALARSPLLTISDLMSHYDCTDHRIRKMIRTGRIPPPHYPRNTKSPRWFPLDILRCDFRTTQPTPPTPPTLPNEAK